MIHSGSSFRPPRAVADGHTQTVVPALMRKVLHAPYMRERLELSDGDFLLLDWARCGKKRLGIISYGMEGDPGRPYVQGMVNALHRSGYDSLVWNFRGCGGETNRKPFFYHAGMYEDLAAVIERANQEEGYDEIVLIGFSLGGVFTLNYLGETGEAVPEKLKSAVCFSVPCDLEACEVQLRKSTNRVYLKRFLKAFERRMTTKFGAENWDTDAYKREIKTLRDFDAKFTCRDFGFADVNAYYAEADCRRRLPGIRIPTLLVIAKNDPFLGREGAPVDAVSELEMVELENPDSGGHVGFMDRVQKRTYWSEARAMRFFSDVRARGLT